MRLLPGACTPLLVLLLVLMTPVGTGDGVHQSDLLHPLLPHVHVVNGRILTHDPSALLETPTPPGGQSTSSVEVGHPALGGGAGAAAAEAGLASSPTPPEAEAVVVELAALVSGRAQTDVPTPVGRVEAPPDPPPTAAG